MVSFTTLVKCELILQKDICYKHVIILYQNIKNIAWEIKVIIIISRTSSQKWAFFLLVLMLSLKVCIMIHLKLQILRVILTVKRLVEHFLEHIRAIPNSEFFRVLHESKMNKEVKFL